MAINILTEPEDPPISGDYTLDQAIQHACEVPQLSILTDWASTTAAPSAKQGAFIRHAGNTFQVQSADEAISGTPASGLNYIIATESSGVITLAWATDISGYTYNPAYGGMYDGDGNQALRDVCFLDGTDYIRGLSSGMDFNTITYAVGGAHPIGYVYIQFPGKASPSEIPLAGTWTNISSDFAGDFFRAEGGDASDFESGEQAYQNAYHRHNLVTDFTPSGTDTEIVADAKSSSSPDILYTTYNGSSSDPEARPVNRTIRLWERTA